jgi:hypothetical protein
MRSECCNAPRHRLFSDCCSDCKEAAEFINMEDEDNETNKRGNRESIDREVRQRAVHTEAKTKVVSE